MSIHLIVTEAEQLAIINALSFYNDVNATPMDDDAWDQWRICFKEDNRGSDWQGPVDQLANKIATLK
jgi:hypothetical protein